MPSILFQFEEYDNIPLDNAKIFLPNSRGTVNQPKIRVTSSRTETMTRLPKKCPNKSSLQSQILYIKLEVE